MLARRLPFGILALALVLPAAAGGSAVQSLTIDGAWQATIAKKPVGTGDRGEVFSQWTLSIAAFDGTAFRLKYRSPRDGGPLTQLTRAVGANLWFPIQSAHLVGAGTFGPRRALVVQSSEFAADCGLATVTTFELDRGTGRVRPGAIVTNPCNLTARIAHSEAGDTIVLTGPYYDATAPRCCPTKPKATATLRFVDGRWIESPRLFGIVARTPLPNR